MARFIFGGEITHLLTSEDTGNSNALIVAPSTTVPLSATPGGAAVTDYLLWDGSAFTIASSTVSSDTTGHLPPFQGPDAVTALYDASGAVLLARQSGSSVTWATIDKPTFVAAGATAAEARDAILAAPSTEMTTAEAQAGTGTTGLLIEPAVLKDGINRHAPANIYVMPLWDGTGSHPLRPTTLPAGFYVRWRQPAAPSMATGYAVTGDEWLATAP